MAEWILKNKTKLFAAYRRLISALKTHKESKGMKKDILYKWKSAESRGSSTYIRQNRLEAKNCNKRQRGHYIMIKGSIHWEDTATVNTYAPNTGAPKYIKQILTDLNKETDSNTIIVGGFKTPLSIMDRSSRKKINKETSDLNYTLHQMALTDIHRAFPSAATEYTFFLSAHGTFSRKYHMLGHKTSLKF